MVQAFAGPMSTTGYPGGTPIRCGVSFIDMSTGLSCYAGVVTALLNREKTGKGTWVRGSLLETAVALMGYHAVGWMQGDHMPEPQGSGSGHLVPYQAFKCSDGYMLAGAPNDAAWVRFCNALEWPELSKDPRFIGAIARAEQRSVLIPMLEERFAQNTVAYWVERFEANTVACSPLQTVDQVMTHPQVLANDMRVQARNADGTMQDLVGTPFKLAEGGGTADTAAPVLGSETEAVLADTLGYSAARIAALRDGGAFALA